MNPANERTAETPELAPLLKGTPMALSKPDEPPSKSIASTASRKPIEKPEKAVVFTDYASI